MSVSTHHGLPLDDDIVDRIMTFCSTFGTLKSTILVSKAFYRVFQTRPKSITRAVAYNIFGPALPQALRVVRYPYHDYTSPSDDPMNRKSCRRTRKLLLALEDVYSVINKDRTSMASILTSDESWRFRRAMYRIMLYCNQFPGSGFIQYDDESIEDIRKQRTAVLSEYSTNELLQLHSAVKFLRRIFFKLSGIDSILIDALLSTGPSGALRGWEARTYGVLEDDIDFELFENDEENPLFVGYLSLPLENIWTACNITPPKEDEPVSKWILDQINGANDTCSQCSHPGGLNLYTEANWQRFPVFLTNLLKGKLRRNPTIAQPFFAATSHLVNADALGPVIGDLFALTAHTAPALDGWERTGSYCFACLTKFLEEHLWVWWLEERVMSGWTPPEDCWYGWNCRTQTHKQSHADTKNHLCAPIKGDPV
ncbi:hypothetical protein B0H14DRAFT_3693301 [Mycena olivaceomarginata]|nr:hypothetical protein B0H14DRAFT_3693301 [Mycena olivaceomarginata]